MEFYTDIWNFKFIVYRGGSLSFHIWRIIVSSNRTRVVFGNFGTKHRSHSGQVLSNYHRIVRLSKQQDRIVASFCKFDEASKFRSFRVGE